MTNEPTSGSSVSPIDAIIEHAAGAGIRDGCRSANPLENAMEKSESLEIMGRDLADIIIDNAAAVGVSLGAAASELAEYAAHRADALSLAVGEPGFDQALEAERDNVALKAAAGAVEQADQVDSRVLATIARSLRIAAVGLAV